MIETVGTYTALEGPMDGVDRWLLASPPGWRVTQDRGTGSLRAVLSGQATPLGRVTISPNRDATNIAARYVVSAEGNLPVLLHGQAAKHLTMLPEHLPAAVDAYAHALHQAVPVLGDVFAAHRLTRVDASMTWRHPQASRAALALRQARHDLISRRSGRCVVNAHGVETVTCRMTAQRLIRAYDKTAETLALARGTGSVPDIGPGVLTRLEVQYRTKTARAYYGETLTHLARTGADMARKAVQTAAEGFGRTLAAIPSDQAQLHRLIGMGATPARAVLLVSVARLLAEGGIPALTSAGVPLPTAYAWRAELRGLLGPLTDEEEEQQHAEQEERLWDDQDAEYYEPEA